MDLPPLALRGERIATKLAASLALLTSVLLVASLFPAVLTDMHIRTSPNSWVVIGSTAMLMFIGALVAGLTQEKTTIGLAMLSVLALPVAAQTQAHSVFYRDAADLLSDVNVNLLGEPPATMGLGYWLLIGATGAALGTGLAAVLALISAAPEQRQCRHRFSALMVVGGISGSIATAFPLADANLIHKGSWLLGTSEAFGSDWMLLAGAIACLAAGCATVVAAVVSTTKVGVGLGAGVAAVLLTIMSRVAGMALDDGTSRILPGGWMLLAATGVTVFGVIVGYRRILPVTPKRSAVVAPG